MGKFISCHLLPSWVEPDPLRGRALDALGLQATADQIADVLLPGISVLTKRARYYAMLAWARRACGTRADEEAIHALEVALAVREARLHPRESAAASSASELCRFVGARNLPRAPMQEPLSAPPRHPADAFRVPVWRGYRASMQNLGLLDDGYALTDEGIALAKRYAAACGRLDTTGRTMLPASACLSRMSRREGQLLEAQLGVWRKGKLAVDDRSAPSRRGATERELRVLVDGRLSVSRVLLKYETSVSRTPSHAAAALREAAAWERLSVGLHAIFLLWLRHLEHPHETKRLLVAARKTRATKRRAFDAISVGDHTAAHAVQSVRVALALRARLEPRGALPHCDPSAFELGEAIVGDVHLDEVFTRLASRHLAAKGDDAWIRPVGRGWELARDADDKWAPPTLATLHGYRLNAFGSLLDDLRRTRP
ncbi:MAG: hypothetical protein ABIY55_14395 [Kofleriaceae bacterium]